MLMRNGSVAILLLMVACSGGSPVASPAPPVITGGGQPAPGSKPIPFSFIGESDDGFTITLQFRAPQCETTTAQVEQTAAVTKVTLLPQNSCSGAPVTQQRHVRLQTHFYPCTGQLIDGGTGQQAPVLKRAHVPSGACPSTP
jgi:hypothetical protein